jgi:hypothetical protein
MQNFAAPGTFFARVPLDGPRTTVGPSEAGFPTLSERSGLAKGPVDWPPLAENPFCKRKEFKRITMRSDRTDQSFAAMIYLSAAIINSR